MCLSSWQELMRAHHGNTGIALARAVSRVCRSLTHAETIELDAAQAAGRYGAHWSSPKPARHRQERARRWIAASIRALRVAASSSQPANTQIPRHHPAGNLGRQPKAPWMCWWRAWATGGNDHRAAAIIRRPWASPGVGGGRTGETSPVIQPKPSQGKPLGLGPHKIQGMAPVSYPNNLDLSPVDRVEPSATEEAGSGPALMREDRPSWRDLCGAGHVGPFAWPPKRPTQANDRCGAARFGRALLSSVLF